MVDKSFWRENTLLSPKHLRAWRPSVKPQRGRLLGDTTASNIHSSIASFVKPGCDEIVNLVSFRRNVICELRYFNV